MPIEKARLVKNGRGFTVLYTDILQKIDNPDALAIWVYLQSKPDDWIVNSTQLRNHFGIGRDRYSKAFKQLKSIDLIRVSNLRGESGHLAGSVIVCNSEPRTMDLLLIDGEVVPPESVRNPDVRENRHVGEPTSRETAYIQNKENIQSKESTNIIKAKTSFCPTTEIVNIYHEVLPFLPQCRKITSARAAAIRQRHHQDMEESLDVWRDYFEYVKQSDFLTGKVNGSCRPFRATLDWLCKADNFAKVYEGKYHE